MDLRSASYPKLELSKRNSHKKMVLGDFKMRIPRRSLLRHSLKSMKRVSKSLRIELDRYSWPVEALPSLRLQISGTLLSLA
jgi:hypothetical protein